MFKRCPGQRKERPVDDTTAKFPVELPKSNNLPFYRFLFGLPQGQPIEFILLKANTIQLIEKGT